MKKRRASRASEEFPVTEVPEKFLLCYLDALFPLIEGRHDSRECNVKLEMFKRSYPEASSLIEMLTEFYRLKFGKSETKSRPDVDGVDGVDGVDRVDGVDGVELVDRVDGVGFPALGR